MCICKTCTYTLLVRVRTHIHVNVIYMCTFPVKVYRLQVTTKQNKKHMSSISCMLIMYYSTFPEGHYGILQKKHRNNPAINQSGWGNNFFYKLLRCYNNIMCEVITTWRYYLTRMYTFRTFLSYTARLILNYTQNKK